MEWFYEMCTKQTIILCFTDLLCLILKCLLSHPNTTTELQTDFAWKSILNKPQYFSIKLYINKTVIKIHDQKSNKNSLLIKVRYKFGHERGVMIHTSYISESTRQITNTSNHARYRFLITVTPDQCSCHSRFFQPLD